MSSSSKVKVSPGFAGTMSWVVSSGLPVAANFEMDVAGAAGIFAGIDGGEAIPAFRIGQDKAAQGNFFWFVV